MPQSIASGSSNALRALQQQIEQDRYERERKRANIVDSIRGFGDAQAVGNMQDNIAKLATEMQTPYTQGSVNPGGLGPGPWSPDALGAQGLAPRESALSKLDTGGFMGRLYGGLAGVDAYKKQMGPALDLALLQDRNARQDSIRGQEWAREDQVRMDTLARQAAEREATANAFGQDYNPNLPASAYDTLARMKAQKDARQAEQDAAQREVEGVKAFAAENGVTWRPGMSYTEVRAQMPKPEEPTGQQRVGTRETNYETPLTPEEEQQFQAWKAQYAPEDSGYDYDLRGAFKAGLTPGEDGHWPDTFKKPNHPTFSVESIYSTAPNSRPGSWEGETFKPYGGGPKSTPQSVTVNGKTYGPDDPLYEAARKAAAAEEFPDTPGVQSRWGGAEGAWATGMRAKINALYALANNSLEDPEVRENARTEADALYAEYNEFVNSRIDRSDPALKAKFDALPPEEQKKALERMTPEERAKVGR